MAITKKLIVTLKDDVATPNEKVYIYRGDIGVDIIIELENFNYRIDSISKKNMINRIEAYFKTPQGTVRKYNDEVDIINGDKIKFSFNKNVINDMQLIGQYELQFHLFDKENNRITIPSYFFYVKEPLHEDSRDEGAVVGYAVVDYSKVQNDDIILFAVDENGYVKTDWKTGDIITASKLNKIETQLESNTNKLNELEPYDDTELNNSLNNLADAINNITNATNNYITNEELEAKGYVTESMVDDKINQAQFGGADLSLYATLEQVDEKIAQSSVLETDMTVINSIGGITAGSDLNGMSTLEILNKLLFPYVAPTYSIVGTPNGGIYEKGNTQTITNVRVIVTKKSEKIIRIEIFDGSTSLGYLEGVDIENGGTFNFSVNVEVNSINKRLTATITDASNNSYSTKTGSFNFIYPYYVGVCEVNDEITETLIKGLTKRIEAKSSKSISYTTNNQKMVFAYPSSYGNIAKILDPNNFDVTNTFNKTTISIIGLDGTAQNYYIYTNSASTVTNFTMKFNY